MTIGLYGTSDTLPLPERFDYFLFLDYETTGDPDQKLLEVGWMLTTRDLEPLFECQSIVIRQPVYHMNAKILKMHTDNKLLQEVANTTTEVWQAEHLVCESIQSIAEQPNNRIVLAGFTCHFDRELMHRDMAKLDRRLHYRHFDVSVPRGMYSNWVEQIPSKKDEHPHRAKDDVLASWEIAKTFRTLFQIRMPKLADPELEGMPI